MQINKMIWINTYIYLDDLLADEFEILLLHRDYGTEDSEIQIS